MLFTNWEIWVCIVVYFILYVLYNSLLASIVMNAIDYKPESGWFLFTANSFVMIILGAVIIAFLIAGLIPVFTNIGGFTPLSILSNNWWLILRTGLFLGIAMILLSLFPIVGKIFTTIPGVSELIQCILAFQIFSFKILVQISVGYKVKEEMYPGYLTVIGFFIFSILTCLILYLITILLFSKFKSNKETGVNPLYGSIGIIPGILCLCMYCSYIVLKMQN